MMSSLLSVARLSVTNPRVGMRYVLDLGLERSILWPAMMLVVALSSVFYNLALIITPPPPGAVLVLPHTPFLLALLMAGVLVLTVFSLHYIGRMLGGVGTFLGSLTVIIWLQGLMLLAQVLQLALLFVAPVIANMFGIGVAIMAIWLLVNFVAELHDFKSLGMVFAGIIVSSIGVLFGASLLLAILSIFLGLDVQNV